ncbi:hypothetical protein [Cobetia sp. 4B]|nr:hypothetical protein [Cobetia sp. 4B]
MPHVSIHPPCLHERGLLEQALITSLSDSQIISSTSDTHHV